MTPEQNRTLCAYCREPHGRSNSHVNRSLKTGALVYCGRTCAGLSRRQWVSKDQRKAEKRAYDMEYRRKNRALLKAKKAAYFQRTYDPAKAAIERKAKMPRHVEYCRRPEYKVKKQAYDQQRRDSAYGPLAEAARLAINLKREINERMSDYEIRIQNQTLNKKQTRDRQDSEGYSRDRHSRA